MAPAPCRPLLDGQPDSARVGWGESSNPIGRVKTATYGVRGLTPSYELSSAEYDNNFDGKPDSWATYKDRFNWIERVDTDFDGKPDATRFYVNGMQQSMDWYPHDSANIERREMYEHGLLKEKLVDTDGDGIFDLRITYDRYERPVEEAKCWVPK